MATKSDCLRTLILLGALLNIAATSACAQTQPLSTPDSAPAQELGNPFKAPLYWDSYEYNYSIDGNIPEKEWAANIDWVEKNLKPYGYDMVAIDGWGDEIYNQDGYRSSHSREWTHDYAWWSRNLQSRGMHLGIYNDPLWIIRAAANAGVKIKGTNIPIKSLLDENVKQNFNWVEVDRLGAEQYIKGYIQYYADMGVRYLRVDFLSWFETGHDQNMKQTVGPKRTRAQYEKALRWMSEACHLNDIFLSLVMPNLFQEAALEKQYGDMIRINEDAGSGQWRRFSDAARGARRPEWSQYANAMDELTYWSYLAGRHRLILAPDLLRLNTFSTDDEKRSVISACLMAGSPVTVADQYSTMGDNLRFYQNREMLALNADGFVGQPLTNDPKDDRSQIWRGRMTNGDWVVGLFNRENDARTRMIDFASLGLKNNVYVRDLWRHSDLGALSSFSATIPPHVFVILRLSARKPTQASDVLFSVPGRLYSASQSVALTTTTPGATIYYTLDGSTPTAASPLYSSTVTVGANTDLKAMVVAPGLADSPVTSETYIIHLSHPLPASWQAVDVGSTTVQGASSSQNAFLAVTRGHGLIFQHRDNEHGGTQNQTKARLSAPVWLCLQRTGRRSRRLSLSMDLLGRPSVSMSPFLSARKSMQVLR